MNDFFDTHTITQVLLGGQGVLVVGVGWVFRRLRAYFRGLTRGIVEINEHLEISNGRLHELEQETENRHAANQREIALLKRSTDEHGKTMVELRKLVVQTALAQVKRKVRRRRTA